MHNRLSQRQCRSLLLTLLIVCTAAQALEAPPDTDNTYAIQTIASDGAFRNMLDFDLDRFERAHVAMIAANGEATAQTASLQLHYTRFDGVVWRDQVVTEFNAPLDSNDGAGLLAATLSERSAPLPSFNMLFLDRGGPGVADDTVRLARAVGDTSTVESVHAGSAERGMQLVAAADGTLHALWLDPALAGIRHARRSPGGIWTHLIASDGVSAPSAPSVAIDSNGVLILGFVEAGLIRLRRFDGNTWNVIAAPALASVRPPLAVQFRADGGIGVAAVRNDDGDALHYMQGTTEAFPAPGVALLLGFSGAFQLLDRNALPYQANPSAPAWLAFRNSGESQLASLPTAATLETQLQFGGSIRGLLLRDDRRYAIAFDLAGHGDVQVHQRGRSWLVSETALDSSAAVLAHTIDAAGSPLLLLRGSNAMQLARWSEAVNALVLEPLPDTLIPLTNEASLAWLEGSPGRTVIAFHHPGTRKLHAIEREPGQAWTETYADPSMTAGSGRQPRLAVDDLGQRWIAHLNLDGFDQLLLTRYGPAPGAVTEVLDTLTSDLSAARPRLAVVPESSDLYLSYHRAGSAELRLLHRRPSGSVASTSITGPDQMVGEFHALTSDAEGQPALAYSARMGAATTLRYRYFRGLQLVDETLRQASDIGTLLGLELSLKNQSADLARVLRLQNGGGASGVNLYFEQRRVGFSPSVLPWRAQRFAQYTPPAIGVALGLDASVSDRVLLLSGGTVPTVGLAQRVSQADDLGVEVSFPLPAVQRFGSRFLCRCPGDEQPGETPLVSCRIAVAGPAAPALRTAGSDALFASLRGLFQSSAAGRYYLDLWGEHGAEIARITLSEPTQLGRRLATLADFTPGLLALVQGNGSQHRMTPAMLLQARGVWEGWRDRGSPALRATMVSELARLQNLTVYNNLSFDAWFAGLSVGSASPRIFRDGFD
jgi:hypothetical protein